MNFLNTANPYQRHISRAVKTNAYDSRNLPGAVTLEGYLGGPVLDALQSYFNKYSEGLMPSKDTVLELIDSPELRAVAIGAMNHFSFRRK